MTNRHQILEDRDFWARLEYDATRWVAAAPDPALRRFWIDGFIPDAATNTQRGLDVEGVVWIGEGSQQRGWRFVASVPQKLLHRYRQIFAIESLSLDAERQCLDVVIAWKEPASSGNHPSASISDD